jgi:hypothetical protein
MLWLLPTLALAGPGNAELACVDELAPLAERAERRSMDEVRTMVLAGQRPELLVPWKFETLGVDKYTGAWRDEAGGRWTWSQVRTLFAGERFSRVHLETLEVESTVAADGAATATGRWASVNAKVFNQAAGNLPLDGDIITPKEFRAERELYRRRMDAAEALGSGEVRHVARAMCAFNMAPRLHAEEAAEREAQLQMMVEAEAAGGPDGATWNLARMLQETRGAGAPDLADAEAVQRCIEGGTGTGELLRVADDAPATGTLAQALAGGGLSCAER